MHAPLTRGCVSIRIAAAAVRAVGVALGLGLLATALLSTEIFGSSAPYGALPGACVPAA